MIILGEGAAIAHLALRILGAAAHPLSAVVGGDDDPHRKDSSGGNSQSLRSPSILGV